MAAEILKRRGCRDADAVQGSGGHHEILGLALPATSGEQGVGVKAKKFTSLYPVIKIVKSRYWVDLDEKVLRVNKNIHVCVCSVNHSQC